MNEAISETLGKLVEAAKDMEMGKVAMIGLVILGAISIATQKPPAD